MKVVILAGGFGTRLSEETDLKPKPMAEVGGRPLLWHIMKIYSQYGFNDFIICLGYKGYMIKEYFANYFLHQSDVTIELCKNKIEIHQHYCEPWKVTLIDTGLNTQTGGRIKRIQKYVGNKTFMLTYGDGLTDLNIKNLIEFHKKNRKYVTLTAVQPAGKFGALKISESSLVTKFQEKLRGDGGWVNGGFYVLEPKIFDYINGDETYWEREPLENLSTDKQLIAYKYSGFWKSMDTLRDRIELENLWKDNNAGWKIWK